MAHDDFEEAFMSYTTTPFAVVISTLLLMSARCQDAIMAPRVNPLPDEPTSPPVEADFPPIPAGALAYNRITPSYSPGRSRYVFYDDSTFGLQYWQPVAGVFEYTGRHVRADSITLYFDDANAAGEWLASGILSGDTLIVKYNLIMALADFEDGAYVLVR
ncbi:MAG TPA: hypothetical protein VE620_10670 [Myxococcales bacterium]|nr:hypothetical protein [Myxococcales bacterium]